MATMRIYYFDDAGPRQANNPKEPFFVLGGFGINAEEVPLLKETLETTALSYGMTLKYPSELKFQHVGTTRDKDPKHPQWMLRAGLSDRNRRRALVYSCLRNTLRLPSAEFICVAVRTARLDANQTAIGTALTPLLERVQMNCQDHKGYGSVLMDEERRDDKSLRSFLRTGSPYLKYDRLLDTIAFMPSEESPGIQVADLIAGSFARHVNYGDSGYLRTFLRFAVQREGNAIGCGVKMYYAADKFMLPDRRPENGAPWSKTDREVHEFEFEAARSETLVWRPDGTPSHAWTDDWDVRPKK